MEQQKLIEKHARALGIPDLEVEWVTLAGAAAQNDALLSGSVAFTANGVPGLLLLWDKTKGEVRGVAALNSGKQLLNTRNPDVRTIADFTDKDKIAVPAVKVSVGAILLQMAAEKAFGEQGRNKLDRLTVGLSHPDAMAALLSNSEVTSHYALEPYSSKELTHPGIHSVLDSDDTLGGPGTINLFVTTNAFRTENPKIYAAFLAALAEADDILNRDSRAAAQLYVAKSKGFSVDEIQRMIDRKFITFTVTPESTMRYAEFMHRVGTIKSRPQSWKDYFFPEIHQRPGS
jgi:NitT/TauT family transport system substrate-binding protein